jgi:micrococcal nuclease
VKRNIRILQVAVLIMAALIYTGFKNAPFNKTPSHHEKYYIVSRVIDGDTLKLDGGQRVRLIGIDTPEVHYSEKLLRDVDKSDRDIKTIQAMGAKASDFTKTLCEGKRVKIVTDVQSKDRYGRTLAYVYLEDGTFVNAKILEEGYAEVMTIPPNVKYSGYFLQLQKEARDKRRGLWSEGD